MSFISTINARTALLAAVLTVLAVVLVAVLSSAGHVSAQTPTITPTPCPISPTTTTPTPPVVTYTPSPTPIPPTITPAPANPPQCLGPIAVNMSALVGVVSGGGTTLTIECKWEAPDMTPYTLPVTYGSSGARDDTPWKVADGPPCDYPAVGPGTPRPTAKPDRHHMMGILANAENLPIQRQYEKWVAVDGTPGAVRDVYFKVWEPYVATPPNGPNCGGTVTIAGVDYPSSNPEAIEYFVGSDEANHPYCLEEQHHATPDQQEPRGALNCIPTGSPIGNPCNPIQSVPCAELAGLTTTMYQQAIDNGAMTALEVAHQIDACGQLQKTVYRVLDLLPKDKPCGEVRVEATVTNDVGVQTHLANYFDNLCFIHLQLDFNAVDWQTLPSTGDTVIGGDLVFSNPQGTACSGPPATSCVPPTVLNTGNAPMYIETMFDPLAPAPVAGDPTMDLTKRISSFDSKLRAQWQVSSLAFETIDPQPSNQWYCFGAQPIGHDQTGKIDFSVHTNGAQAGHWAGKLYIVARFDCASPHVGLHANSPAGGH